MKNRANTRTASNYECLSVRRNVLYAVTVIWDKMFKNVPSKICGR